MQQILFVSFDRRLAAFLLSEARDGTVPLTHEQIARLLGSAREVVSRMLKYFEEEGAVALSRGCISLTDKKRLREWARQ
jgi:CRP/FNR family transcriptional regulator